MAKFNSPVKKGVNVLQYHEGYDKYYHALAVKYPSRASYFIIHDTVIQ